MAEVSIHSAEVIRLFGTKGFLAQTIEVPAKPEPIKAKWTIWTNQKVEVGEVYQIRGRISVKMDEFQDEQGEIVRYARAHVNDAMLERMPTPEDNVAVIGGQELDEVPF